MEDFVPWEAHLPRGTFAEEPRFPRYFAGLDLGQAADYTALAVIEEPYEGIWHLRHLERYPLRTPYPTIASGVARLLRTPPLAERCELYVDATGVGVAVTDLLERTGLDFEAVTITGGEKASREGNSWRVPKRDLVAGLEVSLQTNRLQAAPGLKLWPALREELLNFRRKVNLKSGHDSYEHWRESDHDDLVLAAALAAWGGTSSAAQGGQFDLW